VPEPINYDEIVDRLIQKTEEGKINWQQVFSTTKFTSTVDGEFTFKVERWQENEDTYARLSMTDKEDNEIFQVEADTDFGEFGRKLGTLHEAARRKALNVEDKIKAAKSILDRI
jgi:hypothetical protein